MHRPLLAGMAGAVVIAGSSVGFAISSAAGAPPELARIEKDSLTDQRRPLPTAALQVFTSTNRQPLHLATFSSFGSRGIRSASRRTMSSGLMPSASALKLVMMR